MIADASADQTYERVRPYLFSVAYRMTGSASDAEDLVHDAWIRYLDAGEPAVASLRAWLTTAVSRLALDYLKSARVQREQYTGPWQPEPVLSRQAIAGPEEAVEQRETVSLAFLTLLERLGPEQRVVYVLREALGLSYDQIAQHVDKSAAACRQVFRRAQQRLDRDRQPSIAPDHEHADLAERFLQAVAAGDAAWIAEVVSENVVWIGDGGGKRLAQRHPIVGADRVSRGWAGLGRKAAAQGGRTYEMVHLNGAPAIVIRDRGKLDSVIGFDVRYGRIQAVRAVRNPDKLRILARELNAAVM